MKGVRYEGFIYVTGPPPKNGAVFGCSNCVVTPLKRRTNKDSLCKYLNKESVKLGLKTCLSGRVYTRKLCVSKAQEYIDG